MEETGCSSKQQLSRRLTEKEESEEGGGDDLNVGELLSSNEQQALDHDRRSEVRQAFPQESDHGEAGALLNLGAAYGSLSQYQREIDHYQQALPIFRQVGDRNGEANALTSLGAAYNLLGQYQQAVDY